MDSNKITVTLAGKYSGPIFEKIKKIKQELINQGIDVLYPPEGDMSDDKYGFFEDDTRTGDNTYDFGLAEMNFVYDTFESCDAIILCNYDGYIGKMTSYELGLFAMLICANYQNENKINSPLKGYILVYLLEDIDIEKYRSSDEIGDLATWLEYGINVGLIKIGIDSFYNDIKNGQIKKLKSRLFSR